MSMHLVQRNLVPRLHADVASVALDRLVFLGKGRIEAAVGFVDGLPQPHRVVVARSGAPDGFVVEFKGAFEDVAFDRLGFVVEPDDEFVGHGE